MPSYEIAHLREQGQDIIIVPMKSSFGSLPEEDQAIEIEYIQRCAVAANLKGIVVPVWCVGSRMKFIAPRPWHPFFSSISWNDVARNVNGKLSCS